jgi:hypothetical protein
MNIIVFDTETTSIEKPFCYNVGYAIHNVDTATTLVKREFVCEQVWHNPMLFTTAYYSNKRENYVKRMRARKIKLEKFGFVCQQMIRDIEFFGVEFAYAYNSTFDEKVFNFNCDWFKCNNPFDNLTIIDIRGNVHNKIAFTDEFKAFCEENNRFTEKGNYSTTAETLFQYIAKDTGFEEEHTALADSEIELEILIETIRRGCEWGVSYKTYTSIPRTVEKTLTIELNGQVVNEINYTKKTNRGDKIILKS